MKAREVMHQLALFADPPQRRPYPESWRFYSAVLFLRFGNVTCYRANRSHLVNGAQVKTTELLRIARARGWTDPAR